MLVDDADGALLTIPRSPVDNDRYVKNAPDNPKKVCSLLRRPCHFISSDRLS